MVGCGFADYVFVLFRRRVGLESLLGWTWNPFSYDGRLIA